MLTYFCKDYQDKGTIEDSGVIKSLVYVELYTNSVVGATLVVDASQITNLPKIYDPTKVYFAPGSYVFATSSTDVFIANTQGTFIKQ